jgi:hypothetical protein
VVFSDEEGLKDPEFAVRRLAVKLVLCRDKQAAKLFVFNPSGRTKLHLTGTFARKSQ